MSEREEKNPVRCSLCKGTCSYDRRGAMEGLAVANLSLGFFILPIGICFLFEEIYNAGLIGFVIGLAAWGILLMYFYSQLARWVCDLCGAIYPAIRKFSELDGKLQNAPENPRLGNPEQD